jgi:hypothetical protein
MIIYIFCETGEIMQFSIISYEKVEIMRNCIINYHSGCRGKGGGAGGASISWLPGGLAATRCIIFSKKTIVTDNNAI